MLPERVRPPRNGRNGNVGPATANSPLKVAKESHEAYYESTVIAEEQSPNGSAG